MNSGTIRRELVVRTPDGGCPVTLHSPSSGEPAPLVILYMDGPGIRPAMQAIAERLARARFAVALPDLFWRAGRYDPVDPKVVFADPVLKAEHRRKLMTSTGPDRAVADTRAIIEAAASWPEAARGGIGVVGYCMGGRLALIAAATFPDRVAVAASFHAGGLADDRPSSPHTLADRMRACIYVAGATDDANFDDAQKARLADAFARAGVAFRIESYPARHGWVPADTAAHDPVQAERHWSVLVPLLNDGLRRDHPHPPVPPDAAHG